MHAGMPHKHCGMHHCVYLLLCYLLIWILPSKSCLQWALTALLIAEGRKQASHHTRYLHSCP